MKPTGKNIISVSGEEAKYDDGHVGVLQKEGLLLHVKKSYRDKTKVQCDRGGLCRFKPSQTQFCSTSQRTELRWRSESRNLYNKTEFDLV